MLIKTASLNFSGINVSPFEYHDGSQQKININTCFKRLLDKYLSENSKEYGNIAKIDLVFQKNRYTLLYKANVGILRKKLLSKQQFETMWDHVYEQNQDNIKSIPIKDSEVQALKCFDRMIYEAFLQSIYGVIDWSKIKQYDVELYQQQLRNWHSKCYLKLDLKTQFVRNYLINRDLDVLFLQEAEVEEISKSLPDSYIYTHSSKSMVIIKKDFFEKDKDAELFSLNFNDVLNFNKDSAYVKLKDYLLISVHLSSKKIKCQQAEQLKQTLQKIVYEFPDLRIIIGIDANQYIQNIDNFNVFPQTRLNFTTRKRRTNMQLQFEKAGIVVEDVKDHIITNMRMTQMVVQTIACQQINQQLLPNQHHPFDHFAIFSNIIDDRQKQRNIKNNISSIVQQKRADSKSVSTCNSTKKSNLQKNKKDIIIDDSVPLIVISPCEQQSQTTASKNKNQQLKNSNDFSRSSQASNFSKSRNSQYSKSSRTKKLQPPNNQILKFRKSSNGIQQNKEEKQKSKGNSYLRPDVGGFKFRQTNQSKSVQKPSDRPSKSNKPSSILLALTPNKRAEAIKSQINLSPAGHKHYRGKHYKY